MISVFYPANTKMPNKKLNILVQEDLDYTDDIGLLSSKHQDAQQKAEHLSQTASTVGLKVNTKKTQVLRKNTRVNYPVMIDGKNRNEGRLQIQRKPTNEIQRQKKTYKEKITST